MIDAATVGPAGERAQAVSPLEAAMGLLREAEDAAERTRTEADRYARQRAVEADLLVAKARRLLVAAEERAAVIVATARAEGRQVIDLDALSAGAERREVDGPSGSPTSTVRAGHLDDLFASAIANAVDHALRSDQRA